MSAITILFRPPTPASLSGLCTGTLSFVVQVIDSHCIVCAFSPKTKKSSAEPKSMCLCVCEPYFRLCRSALYFVVCHIKTMREVFDDIVLASLWVICEHILEPGRFAVHYKYKQFFSSSTDRPRSFVVSRAIKILGISNNKKKRTETKDGCNMRLLATF